MPNKSRLTTLALLLLAFALWMPRLQVLDLWGDELYTAAVTGLPFAEMMRVILVDAVHPPLYYLLTVAWRAVAGGSAFALRYPSVLAMLLGLALTARLARELLDTRAARLTLLLAAFNPFLLWYAQEMRMYALLLALTAAEMLCLRFALRGRRWAWPAQAAITALLINTHYFGFFALLPTFAYLVAERRWRRQLPRWFIAHAAGGLTFLPWFLAWINRDPMYVGIGWIPPLRPLDLALTLRTFFFSGTEGWWLPALLGGAGLLAALVAPFTPPATQRAERHWRTWLLLAWALPLSLTALISWTMLALYVDRYFVIVLPALFIWLAWGLLSLPRWPMLLALTGLLMGMGTGIVGVSTRPGWQRPAWDEALAHVQAAYQPGEALMTNSQYASPARLYYAPDLPPIDTLLPPDAPTLGPSQPTPTCDPGQTCWMIWEQVYILIHFPPTIGEPLALARELAQSNPTAAWFLVQRESCQIETFTHIEVWRCEH